MTTESMVTQDDRDCRTELERHLHVSHAGPFLTDDALDVLARHRTAAQPEREAVLEGHFPTGLRSTRHVLSATGEVFETPIQCECHCGACFVGTDEQEVRQLWAAHAAALTTPAPVSRDEIEAVAKIIDPDPWHETLSTDGRWAYWIGRRYAAKDKARAILARLGEGE